MVPDTFAIARECRANNLQKWWLKLEEKNRPTNRPPLHPLCMQVGGTTGQPKVMCGQRKQREREKEANP